MGGFYSNKKRVLFLKFEETEGFLPVGYLIGNSIEEDVEMIPTTTSQNEEGWRTSRPYGMQGFQISFSALQINTAFAGGDFTRISYDRLKMVKRSRKLIEWRLITTDLQFVDFGKGHITQLSEPTEPTGFLKYSATLIGYGKPTSTTEREILLGTGEENKVVETGVGIGNVLNP